MTEYLVGQGYQISDNRDGFIASRGSRRIQVFFPEDSESETDLPRAFWDMAQARAASHSENLMLALIETEGSRNLFNAIAPLKSTLGFGVYWVDDGGRVAEE